ncbi:hypothetical protein KIPB_011223, partial [Kipferlia bialata]
LHFQCPCIERMDQSLSTLTNCRHLSLSSNNIARIAGLTSLPNLEILSLGRNLLKRIEGLEQVAGTLKELWISYNSIEKFSGLMSCKKLTVLYASNNAVSSWAEIERLTDLPDLQELQLTGCPIELQHTADGTWRKEVVKRLPKLKKLDGLPITDEDRGQ